MIFFTFTTMTDLKVFITKDGSSTLFNSDLDEHYHSVNGAITESNHVFIQAGLEYTAANKTELSILEMGFGTGLNTFLTFLRGKEMSTSIIYHTLETHRLPWDQVKKLDYIMNLNSKNQAQAFEKMHCCDWDVQVAIENEFILKKMNVSLEKFITRVDNDSAYDLIYYDAFAPSAQPHLWTPEVFNFLYKKLNKGGVLTTYCAKGQVKRDLKSAGFHIESLPGPPGKREMTRALKH